MQKIQLSIPEPCHENWNEMTPAEQGRFCTTCSKVVVDFAMMTDTEVLNYFKALTHQKVCGRVLPSQLEREITLPKEPRKRKFWYWNYIAMFFLFLSKAMIFRAQGQAKVETVLQPGYNRTLGEIALPEPSGKLSYKVEGKIVDADNNLVPFASVMIKGSKNGVTADANGYFSLQVMQADTLVFSASGLRTVEMPVVGQEVLFIKMVSIGSRLKEANVLTVAGGISYRDPEEDQSRVIKVKQEALLVIKDSTTGQPVVNAAVYYNKMWSEKTDNGLSDKAGQFRLERDKEAEGFNVKIVAEGYAIYEVTLTGNELNNRKETWEVFLEKRDVVIQ